MDIANERVSASRQPRLITIGSDQYTALIGHYSAQNRTVAIVAVDDYDNVKLSLMYRKLIRTFFYKTFITDTNVMK